jgi:hypothetical protein
MLNKISEFQETRIMITPRLNLIMKKGADRRRENLFIAHEIAFLISEKNNRPGNRNLILIKRSTRSTADQILTLQQISYIYSLYHILHYILLYTLNEPGRDFSIEFQNYDGIRKRFKISV